MIEKLKRIVITDIEEVITVHSPKGKQVSVHNRRTYGLSFCEKGQITYHHKGRDYVSDSTCVIFLPQGESYSLTGNKTGDFPVVNFTCAEPLCDTPVTMPFDEISALYHDFSGMQTAFLFPDSRTKVIGILYQMLYRLIDRDKNGTGLLAPAIRYLEKQYGDSSLNNRILSSQCGISEIYFRRLFVKRYGVTPRQYVIDIRMSRAKQLLSEGRLKISAVSEACGFSNPYHFCRMFKEKNGITPTEYMKENHIYRI